VHLGVVNYLAGMEISTIGIANVDMLCASLYDPSCDMTTCALIFAIDREWRCVFAMYITVVRARMPASGLIGIRMAIIGIRLQTWIRVIVDV